ncbi:probable cysteine--tRNA ligase, mitochondrial [Lingula anatina]|uniref:cysteine--tRNA ligase n=1 Tax=Lingula anatina TaxID=7574 RepID=A0A1S3JNT9_LINAN|nr:probable cysteine--tRNA ligase, mitochondrial [Lingula anatina]|eukprot:XP_013411806.1 probable cysteine--tRNA ligase, mitochondrial [Lingula anatina]
MMALPVGYSKYWACVKCASRISNSEGRNFSYPKLFSTTSSFKTKNESAWIEPQGYNTGVKVYNSLTRKKDYLVLPSGPVAFWYMCGPTVYDEAHIGHASSYVRFDIIKRILQSIFNINVVQVMGITDIDDKIIKRSIEVQSDCSTISRKYEQEFDRDMLSLNVLPPAVKTRVTEHIPQILDFVRQIMDKKLAYVTKDGSVYFDVEQYGYYGKLMTHSVDAQIRDAEIPEKRSARDFALWKAAKPGEPWWESPWGRGRPGWHIECSAMAHSIFGEKLDIHTGGEDLLFPHHENELAQSQACLGCDQWCNYWMHTGHLHSKGDAEKMSKSLKNTLSITELLQTYTANQFRMFCMLSPYRNRLEYSDETMLRAVAIHQQLMSFLNTADLYVKGQLQCQTFSPADLMKSLQDSRSKVMESLTDDFNTQAAVENILHLVYSANVSLGIGKRADAESSGSRHPAAVAAIAEFIEQTMNNMGVGFVGRKGASEDSHSAVQLGQVMDEVLEFRKSVRLWALDVNAEVDKQMEGQTDKSAKKQIKKEVLYNRQPLLKACDDLRGSLQGIGIQVKDISKENSTWEFVEKTQQKKD